jgi:hypothetical protein
MTDPQELTERQQLVALETYIKFVKGIADGMRARVTKDMGDNDDERVGAKLPDGTKLGSITYSEGRRTAKVTDEAALLAWCTRAHPSEIQTITIVRPAYLKMLLDLAKADDAPAGAHGVDPETGEELLFIEVQQGDPYISVTSTKEGTARMAALATGFPKMLAGPQYGPGQGPAYDPDFADRLENGGYR